MRFVKICGLTREQDVEAAIEAGANAIGFVLEPTSIRFIPSVERLVELARCAKEASTEVIRVGVFGFTSGSPYASLPQLALLDAIQSLDEAPTDWSEQDWRAARVGGPNQAFPELMGQSMLVLDAYSETGLGGTGTTSDWELARAWVSASPIPALLAGGLNPRNVAQAIQTVQPYGVDVSTGVEEAPGIKDRELLREFIAAAKSV